MTSENSSLWTKEQLASWERDGFLLVPGLLDDEELAAIRKVPPSGYPSWARTVLIEQSRRRSTRMSP